MRRLIIAVAIVLLSSAGCKKKQAEPGTGTGRNAVPGTGTEAPAGTGTAAGTAPVGGAGGTGSRVTTGTGGTAPATAELMGNKKASNCPSVVTGAETKIIDDPNHAGKLVLQITASDKSAIDEIRRRTKHLIDVQAAPDLEVKHTGEGTGGGAGSCPVATLKDTKLSWSDIEGGAKVVIEVSGALALDALQRGIDERITRTSAWSQSPGDSGDRGEQGGGGGEGQGGGGEKGEGKRSGKPKTADEQEGGNRM